MLVNSLHSLADKKTLTQSFVRFKLGEKVRPEELNTEQWAMLAQHLVKSGNYRHHTMKSYSYNEKNCETLGVPAKKSSMCL
jgi:hypothetical protein